MSDGDDDLSARLANFHGKRPRLDMPALKQAIEEGRQTLLDPGVASEAATDPTSAPSVDAAKSVAKSLAASAAPVDDGAGPTAPARGTRRATRGSSVRTSMAIPRDVHLALRLHCLRQGRQLQDVILDLIEAERRRGGFDA